MSATITIPTSDRVSRASRHRDENLSSPRAHDVPPRAPVRQSAAAGSRSEAGFTLVEVLVAAFLVVVGILGTMETISVANRGTSNANARTGATNVARRVVEAARAVPGGQLTQSTLLATLKSAAPDLPEVVPDPSSWTVQRQGQTYTITPTVCAVDDPGDGLGSTSGSPYTFCSSQSPTSPPDTVPADYQQVSVQVAWTSAAGNGSVKQVVDVPLNGSGALPFVKTLTMTSPLSCTTGCPAITSQTTTSAAFSVTAGNSPASMTWLVDGSPKGTCPPTTSTCSGSGAAWSFTWGLGALVKDSTSGSPNNGLCMAGTYTYDGIHQVGARVQSATGLAGADASMPVSVNRCAAIAPPAFNATERDKTGTPRIPIDTEWQDNPEGDIVGYRVYKGTSLANKTPVCPASVSSGQVIPVDAGDQCTDPSPPDYSSSAYYYSVYAVDRDPSGNLREGAVSYTIAGVNTGNKPPKAPVSFALTPGANVTLSWTLPSTPLDPDSGDTIDSFRVYRKDGTGGTPTYLDRYDRDRLQQLCSGTSCSYTDTATGATTHTYWVTAVDTNLRESSFTAAKSG